MERYWWSGRLLAGPLKGEALFPLAVTFRKPNTADLAERFDDVRLWIRELEAGSGYEIEWTVRNHRQVGTQKIPDGIVVPTEADALRLIGKKADAETFRRLVGATLDRFPTLISWLARRPLVALENAAAWNRVLEVLAWFRSHPGSNLYLRQIEIAGVDTKFIEERRGLLAELLDAVGHPGIGMSFEQRFGLRQKPALVRFRFLDKRLYMQGLSDLAIPGSDFARIAPGVDTVFVTENEINGLTFPDVPGSLVIFGLGYGLERLSQATWLGDKTIYYWGDIDTHGFAMLHRFRGIFPGVRSLLMDRETLLLHRDSWGQDGPPYAGPLDWLTADERSLFDDLQQDRFGVRVRLEQERISFGHVRRALERLRSGG